MRRTLLSGFAALALSACGPNAPTDTCGAYPPVSGAIDADTWHEVIDWAVTDLGRVPGFTHGQICEGIARISSVSERLDVDPVGQFVSLRGIKCTGQTFNVGPDSVKVEIAQGYLNTRTVTHEIVHAMRTDLDPEHTDWEARGVYSAIDQSGVDMGTLPRPMFGGGHL